MSETSPVVSGPPTKIEDLPIVFQNAFNARDLETLTELFEPEAMHVLSPGVWLAGAERRAAAPLALRDRLPITVKSRHVYVVGDIALLINDYVHEGSTPAGEPIRVEGTATDVARRGPDGVWRCVISNPSGTRSA